MVCRSGAVAAASHGDGVVDRNGSILLKDRLDFHIVFGHVELVVLDGHAAADNLPLLEVIAAVGFCSQLDFRSGNRRIVVCRSGAVAAASHGDGVLGGCGCGGVNCGDLQLELDRAVGIIILYQLCVLAVYLQLHIVGKGHARLGLQINVGRIFLTDLKRVTIIHAEPEHQGRFELIRIAAGHGEVHGAVGMLAGHRRCYLHRRLRHIVRVCGGVFGEVHNDNRECIISANLFDDSIGNGNIFLSKIFCNGNSVFKVEVEQCGVALSEVVCVVVIQSSRRKRITLTENLGAQLHHIRSGGIGRS